MKLLPMNNRLLVRRDKSREETTTEAGLILPENDKEIQTLATVLAVGEAVTLNVEPRTELIFPASSWTSSLVRSRGSTLVSHLVRKGLKMLPNSIILSPSLILLPV